MKSPHRDAIRTARGLVVKVGTTAPTTPSGMFDAGRLAGLAEAVERRMKAGSDVVIVSSGAMRPPASSRSGCPVVKDLATKQAAASVGQVALVNSWSAAFARYGRTVGPGAADRARLRCGCSTPTPNTRWIGCALHAGGDCQRERHRGHQRDPDSVCDNDRLSALVAHLVGADALVLLSDIDGPLRLRPAQNRGRDDPFSEVSGPADPGRVRVAGRSSHLVLAAWRPRCRRLVGRPTPGCRHCWPPRPTPRPRSRRRVGGHGVCGARPARLSARRFWVRYAAEATGARDSLDAGAVRAVVRQRRSLLAAGITAVSGRFCGGDVVELRALRRSHGSPRGGCLRRVRAGTLVGRGPPLSYPASCAARWCTPDDLVASVSAKQARQVSATILLRDAVYPK
ncbi:PUA domain-containing protein [Mycobacterium tuberculosis]